MPSEKEEKYMETKKATIKREDSNSYLVLEIGQVVHEINLTDNNPNKVKMVFNELLKELKKGLFNYVMEDQISDLYHHICLEYITQLNAEIKAIHNELIDYELIDA